LEVGKVPTELVVTCVVHTQSCRSCFHPSLGSIAAWWSRAPVPIRTGSKDSATP
jgi:hypothetical protein